MRKLLRILILFSLFIVLSILLFNSVNLSSKQLNIDQVEGFAVNNSVLGRLSKAIEFPAITTNQKADSLAFKRLWTWITGTFPNVHAQLDVTSINTFSRIYKWEGRDRSLPPILLLTQIDVVPPDVASLPQWKADPFLGRSIDGFIYGAGAMSGKVNAIAILESLEQLAIEEYFPGRTIYFAVCHDHYSKESGAKAIASYFSKRNIQFEYILDGGSYIRKGIVEGVDGLAIIGVSEKGNVEIRLSCRLKGENTESAISRLTKATTEINKRFSAIQYNSINRQMLKYIAPERRGIQRVVYANSWLLSPFVNRSIANSQMLSPYFRTSVDVLSINAGRELNLVPENANALFRFHILEGNSVKQLKTKLEKLVQNYSIDLNVEKDYEPTKVAPVNSFGYNVIQKSIRELQPNTIVVPGGCLYTTPSWHFENLSDQLLRFSPVEVGNRDIKRIGGVNERISQANYLRTIQFYYQLLRNSSV